MRSPRFLPISALLVAAAAAGCGGDDDDDGGGVTPIPYVDDGKLTVMTRNLYLGADLQPVIDAGTNPIAFVTATTQVWAQVQANRFDLRAEALANEVLANLPDVIGLQEVSLWRTQSPSDAGTGAPTPATTVAIDYLAILQAALAARGLSYVAAQTLELFDVEVPAQVGSALQDVRLTDRQVILVREGVPVVATPSDKGIFSALLPLPVAGIDLPVKRGWTKVEVTIGSGAAAEDVAVYDVHLEAFGDPVRDVQAGELVTILAGEASRLVLVGDLNARPDEGAYGTLTDAGLADVWIAKGTGDGFTCCFAGNLTLTNDPLDERIDHIFTRGGTGDLTPESVTLVGEETADRTPSALWPSDHAGVVATIAP